MTRIKMIGDRYGKLTVTEEVEKTSKDRRFLCKCDCGNELSVNMSSLRQGNTKSCGCLHREILQKRKGVKLNVTRSDGKKVSIGDVYGELTTIKELESRLNNEIAWLCRCSCGNETTATRGQLLNGRKKSCGCLRKKSPDNTIDMVGKKFGKLLVVERAGRTINDNANWLCKCDCGKDKVANGTSLRRGDTVSCGCSNKEQMSNAKKVLTIDKSIDGVMVPLLTKKVRSDSGSGHKGIYRRERNGKVTYEPRITIKGKVTYLGVYDNLNDAIKARKQGELEYHQPYIKALEEKENDKRENQRMD